MPTDYLMFIHGVDTRYHGLSPTYADQLFAKLQKSKTDNSRRLSKVALYWGDVNEDAENRLLKTMQKSATWKNLWFQNFRSNQILEFVGDAALYISRYLGARVVKQLKTDAERAIANFQPEDRLHLITHSWGTVILLDILFAPRWNEANLDGYADVMDIRDKFFGITGQGRDTTQEGIVLASIHTMGSPIPLFSLTSNDGSTNDISQNLQRFLANLHEQQQRKLPWRNYIHPGDPIAYPIKELMADLAGESSDFLDLEDILTEEAGIINFMLKPLSQNILAIIQGGEAHGSYWNSDQVASKISQFI